MEDQGNHNWAFLSTVGPVFMFGIVLVICIRLLNIPLVLSVVLACLLAIVEWVFLKWLARRAGQRH